VVSLSGTWADVLMEMRDVFGSFVFCISGAELELIVVMFLVAEEESSIN
jgi:hypothetical protein